MKKKDDAAGLFPIKAREASVKCTSPGIITGSTGQVGSEKEEKKDVCPWLSILEHVADEGLGSGSKSKKRISYCMYCNSNRANCLTVYK